jgi:hypothetical protein
VIGTQILTAGGSATTISGTTLLLGVGETEVVYSESSTTHLGSIMQSFIAPAQYAGGASKGIETGFWRAVRIAVVLSTLMIWV